ncbi:short-chain dehydrogenase/reductase SDR [Patulibacter medicamentivorans]|uniref:Peroxisomal trans-2-enoyl-CoA reductase n=1 Tax=Patulibacter medicamentivorans TaxID=1097667 RepID=H0E8B9_9ACTN|nr:SDR family oxidoreductase [Patulibacter medicamentivorans]EHN10061.1 short-chain dehydrogenase/reductase SDR [Patulibacter medicamentivorans]
MTIPETTNTTRAANPSAIFAPGLLDGQVVLVSGGGSGLGRAAVLELVALGARVAICGRRADALEDTAASAGAACSTHVCDIRDEDQVDRLVDDVLARHGRIDTLVNNAGGQFLAPAETISPKGFRTVTRLNLDGTWLMTHAVATKAMIPAGPDGRPAGGKVVSVTLSPHHGLPGMVHSSAARAAVENMMRELSIEWARFGIRLNAIAAGQFATDIFMTKYPRPMVDAAAGLVPLGRLGTPEEFAWLVAYLASPAGDFFSGSVLTLDGARDNHTGPWPAAGSADAAGNPLTEARQTRDPSAQAPR